MRLLDARREPADPGVVSLASSALARGELIIYPTDTLYALGGRALDAGAVDRTRAAKGRDEGKPLPVVAENAAQARALWRSWPVAADVLAERFWPGPLTLVLPAAPGLPPGLLAGGNSVGVRVPALALTRSLCGAAGPLVSTSANRAGGLSPRTCGEAVAAVGGAAALALDGGPGRGVASTVLDLTEREPRVLREGAIPWAAIAALLKV